MIYISTLLFLLPMLLLAGDGTSGDTADLPAATTGQPLATEIGQQPPATEAPAQAPPAVANDNLFEQQAYLLYNRIAGVPPDQEVLKLASDLLAKGKKGEAALLATKDPAFYDVKLRTMFSAWSNVNSDVSGELNDMVATMIGMVRDDVPFNEVLSADLVYTVAGNEQASQRETPPKTGNKKNQQQPAEISQVSDLQKKLIKSAQSEMPNALPEKAIAGVLSTEGFGEAFYSAGTNRRATAFVLKNFLCHEIEELHDTKAGDGSLSADQFVRQDVDRMPGGDGDLFRSKCLGCHAGMDAMSGWSVYYDYNTETRQLIYTEGLVQEKVSRNKYLEDEKFIAAHTPVDDSFTNIWVKGPNAKLGWGANTSGSGAAEWGQMITASKAFAHCMVEHAYQAVCLKEPESSGEQEVVAEIAELFITDNYKMRNMIAATAVACLTPNTSDAEASSEQPTVQGVAK